MTEVSFVSRLEPRPRDNDLRRSLSAEIHDPLWFLARQWQMGEYEGEDTGSVAYVEYDGATSVIPRWVKSGTEVALDQGKPLEAETLREPFEPDLGLQVELGQDFADILLKKVNDPNTVKSVLDAFRALTEYQIHAPVDTNDLDPVDPASKRFLRVTAQRSVNGFALYTLGIALETSDSLPPGLPTTEPLAGQIKQSAKDLVARSRKIFGDIGFADPVAWQKERLEYKLEVVGVDPAGKGNARLAAHPDSNGEYEWYSFDVASKNETAVEAPPKSVSFTMVPTRVQFDGMPAPRFWNFEENTLSVPDITAERDDLVKLMAADFMLVHSNDWYVLPYPQRVGTLARTDDLRVRDVFGYLTRIARADADATAPGTDRWTMFSTTDLTNGRLAEYFVLPPTSGPATEIGTVLEDVRFGRDEMANMAWGIERVTASPIGEPRSGRERAAEIDQRIVLPAAPAATEFPLRYDIESDVPANWVPLVPVQLSTDASIALQRARAVKRTSTGSGPVPALSNILNPDPAGSIYRIAEEEIPRAGLRVERVVYRARWIDGTNHLWVQRRRRIGAGEAQSGLLFDQAMPNTP